MQIHYLVYCLASFIFSLYLLGRAEKKWFLSALLFWLFSTSLLGDQNYPVRFHLAGIDLQPDRVLFLFLLTVLFLFILQVRIKGKSLLDFSVHRLRFYELWMIIYLGIAILILFLNASEIGARTAIVKMIRLLTFLLVYFFSRELMSSNDFHLFVMAIVTFALFSSLVGIYQFIWDPNFFRVGVSRVAFESYIRGNGFFSSEYNQGLFLCIALVLGMLTIQNGWGRLLIITILPIGVFCTMHRASWIMLIIVLGVVFIRDIREYKLWILTISSILLVMLVIVSNTALQKFKVWNLFEQMIQNRVKDNTLDVRVRYNQFAMEIMRNYPIGIGDYSSSIYYREAYNESMDFLQGKPLIVHNGFLSADVLYGVAGMVSFTMFLLSVFTYYLRKNLVATNTGFIALSILLLFVIINMTQDFSFLGNQLGLLLGLVIGTALSQSLREKPISKPDKKMLFKGVNA